ncbi:MAG: DUF3842 family protein [Thomasclavelia ramosa]
MEALKKEVSGTFIIAVGKILQPIDEKGGADAVATGENAIIYNAKNAQIIIGPIGFVFAQLDVW